MTYTPAKLRNVPFRRPRRRSSRFMSAPYDRSMHNTYYTTFGISMPLLEQHRKNERAGTSDGVYDRLIPRDFLTLRSNESKYFSRANSRTGITFLS